jgi:hypothetical protein
MRGDRLRKGYRGGRIIPSLVAVWKWPQHAGKRAAGDACVQVFVSYSHTNTDWVRDRLVPVLKASGAEVFVDVERFEPGGGMHRQMDEWQDKADKHVLVLSDGYSKSPACQREMARAIATDLGFAQHKVLPIRRDDTKVPDALLGAAPILYTDLRADPDDATADAWKGLIGQCGQPLGAAVQHFLSVRDEVARVLATNKSVNLVVDPGIRWAGLIDDLAGRSALRLARLDLFQGGTETRHGFVSAVLGKLGHSGTIPEKEHLATFNKLLARLGPRRLALEHFDFVAQRPEYDVNLFTTLLYEVTKARTLVLLLQSHSPVANLLPNGPTWSEDLGLHTVNFHAGP